MSDIAQDLGGVVRLLEKATPGSIEIVQRDRDGSIYARVGKAEIGHAHAQGDIHLPKEDAEAMAAAVNFLRTHSAEIAGALAAFKRVRDALDQPDLIGPASHFRSEEEVIQTRVLRALIRHELNWHTAMQQGGGGGEAAA